MKKILIYIFMLLTILMAANSAEYYSTYKLNFADDEPSNVYVKGGVCQDSSCSSVKQAQITFYDGDKAIKCMDDALAGKLTIAQFDTCMDKTKVTNDKVSMDGSNLVVTKVNVPNSFGDVIHFFPKGDNYLPKYFRTKSYVCEYDICLDTSRTQMNFEKEPSGIAEIGQVNVINVEDSTKPIQISVPVEVEETVCSAFRYAKPNMWKPSYIPDGYSDFSVDTKISLKITSTDDGEVHKTDSVVLPIEAEECAGLTTFKWTPDADMQNEEIKFKLTTDVVDEQIEKSIRDSATVIQTVYPEDLSRAAWSLIRDYTLSNVDSFEMNTSVAQITQGEYLQALFKAGAWVGNDKEPTWYDAELYIDGVKVFDNQFDTTRNGFDLHSINLTEKVVDFEPGSYEVMLRVIPMCTAETACVTIREYTYNIQNLEILPPKTSEVKFIVEDVDGERIQGADINLKLLDVDEYFVEEPDYNKNGVTNANGVYKFTNALRGDYKYEVEKDGYNKASEELYIGADMDIYVILYENETENGSETGNAPVNVDLPSKFTEYYKNDIVFDARDYVFDSDNTFDELGVTYSKVSGDFTVEYSNGIFTISANKPMVGELKVKAVDPYDSKDTDTVMINFIDNEAPTGSFEAVPDNGEEPFKTTFDIEVSDADGDDLTCSLYFGDGSSAIKDKNCDSLDGTTHTYTTPETYTAKLVVKDGVNTAVTFTDKVFVYERTGPVDPERLPPVIEHFSFVSSNGKYVPTKLTFTWEASHPQDADIECEIRVNDKTYELDSCDDSDYLPNFDKEGISKFTFYVEDEYGLYASRTLERKFFKEGDNGDNQAPVIKLFTVDSSSGQFVPTDLTFNWKAVDSDGDDLTCEIRVNQKVYELDSCDSSDVLYAFDKIGESTFVFYVEDEFGLNDQRTIKKTFKKNNNGGEEGVPEIGYFTLESSNGQVVPTDLTLSWSATHTGGQDMVCKLLINGVAQTVDCVDTMFIEGYDKLGESTFEFIVVDSDGDEDSKKIVRTFYDENEVAIPLDAAELIIDSVIVPGEFDFQIIIHDEILDRRIVSFNPIIRCEGIDNHLSDSNDVELVSKSSFGGEFTYNLVTNTRDYELLVPTGKACRFNVELKDEYGTALVLSETVMFEYEDRNERDFSIRGKGTDIVNFMADALVEGVEPGYNTIEFEVTNNERFDKKLSLTIISSELGIAVSEQETLAGDANSRIIIPVFVDEDTEPGLYPVRFGAYDGEDKHSRYGYIKVN